MTDLAPAVADSPARRHAAFPWAWVAGLTTAAAGGLHVAAAADHRAAGNLVVGFFLLTAFAQLWLAAALPMVFRYCRATDGRGLWAALVTMAIAGTVALVALYVVVHATDLLAGIAGHEGAAAAGHDHSAGGTGHPIETGGPLSLSSPTTAGEPPDTLGTVTVAVELLAIAAFTALLPRSWRSATTNALLLLGGLAWALWLAGVLG
jgi:asparagine N-glycosylation enzyme membrane subunit Stt3